MPHSTIVDTSQRHAATQPNPHDGGTSTTTCTDVRNSTTVDSSQRTTATIPYADGSHTQPETQYFVSQASCYPVPNTPFVLVPRTSLVAVHGTFDPTLASVFSHPSHTVLYTPHAGICSHSSLADNPLPSQAVRLCSEAVSPAHASVIHASTNDLATTRNQPITSRQALITLPHHTAQSPAGTAVASDSARPLARSSSSSSRPALAPAIVSQPLLERPNDVATPINAPALNSPGSLIIKHFSFLQ